LESKSRESNCEDDISNDKWNRTKNKPKKKGDEQEDTRRWRLSGVERWSKEERPTLVEDNRKKPDRKWRGSGGEEGRERGGGEKGKGEDGEREGEERKVLYQ